MRAAAHYTRERLFVDRSNNSFHIEYWDKTGQVWTNENDPTVYLQSGVTFDYGGRTMYLSIHQIGDAARVCDRFVLLSGGRVCGEGTLPELSALAAARSGSPATDDLEEVFLALT